MAKDGSGTVVRRVKASASSADSANSRNSNHENSGEVVAKKVVAKSDKTSRKAEKSVKIIPRARTPRDPSQKCFILFRPFCAVGRYFRDSWRELRQVRWTNRKATWALTLAVILFSAFFAIFVLLFDNIFQWLVKEVIL